MRVVMIMRVITFRMLMCVAVLVTVMGMVVMVGSVMPVIVGMAVSFKCRIARLLGQRGINRICIDDIALHPFATVATAGVAMTRALAVRAVVGLFLGFAMGAFIR